MFFVVIIWSAVFPLSKIVQDNISPYAFIFYRSVVSGLVCFIFMIFQKKKRISQWKLIAGSSFCFIVTMTSLSKAVSYIDSSLSAFIFSTSIVFVTAIESFLRKKHPTKRQIIGIIICLVGAILMIENLKFEMQSIKGVLFCLLGTISSSLGVIIINKVSFNSTDSSVRNVFLQNILCFIFSLVFFNEGIKDFPNVNMSSLWIILYCSIFSSIISIIMQFYAQKKISSQSAVIIIMLEPLFAAIMSVFILRENIFSVKFISGAILIIGSLIFTSLKKTE